MMQQAQKKGQALLVIGMSVLVVSTVMLTRQVSDFGSGLSFGVGIGLLVLGIHALNRR